MNKSFIDNKINNSNLKEDKKLSREEILKSTREICLRCLDAVSKVNLRKELN